MLITSAVLGGVGLVATPIGIALVVTSDVDEDFGPWLGGMISLAAGVGFLGVAAILLNTGSESVPIVPPEYEMLAKSIDIGPGWVAVHHSF